MNILYIAYSCAPDHGSEDKIGWNIPLASAAHNRVFVITKEEHREAIETYRKTHDLGNIRFFYVDIPAVYKKILKKGAAYSARLNIWHRRAFPVAKRLCEAEVIDVIHQITPIELRSIGSYWKIENTKFVCGPLGGGEYIPSGLTGYARGHMTVERIRALLNRIARLKYRLTGSLKKCDYILFANRETKAYLSDLLGNVPRELYFDNGIGHWELPAETAAVREDGECVFLTAGRLAYRKGHDLLLDAVKRIPENYAFRCRIVGDGPELRRLRERCEAENLSHRVTITGRIPFSAMSEEYACADVFVMPSIRETSGAVLLEAMSKPMPVITMKRFGGAVVLDSDSGWLFEGTDRESYIENLKNSMIGCIERRETVAARGAAALEAARAHTWEKKAAHYDSIYRQVTDQKDRK